MTDAERKALILAGVEQAKLNLDAMDARVLAELESLFALVVRQIQQRITFYSDNDGYLRTQFTRPLLRAIRDLLTELSGQRNTLLRAHLTRASESGAAVAGELVSPVIISESIANSVKAVYELEQADGLQLSERLWKLDQGAKQKLGQAIRQQVATGTNPLKAAREFIRSGEAVPPELLQQANALRTENLNRLTGEQIQTGKGSALYNAQRVFQTEMKRANGIALVESTKAVRGLIGYQFKLSPLHKKVDICDKLAQQDKYGLGNGVYPADVINSLYPAHPNTRSYIVPVFDD